MSSPNPAWKPGDKINAPVGEQVAIDPAALPVRDMYHLMNGTIIPRPIAFVSTINAAGVVNLAPFSFFNGVSSNPPCLMVSIAPKSDGSKKDTLRNIEETGQFVVNTASLWLAEPLVYCGAEFAYGVNEMAKAGLTPMPSIKVKAPRVKEAAVNFECELYKLVQIGDGTPGSSTAVFGKIVQVHIIRSAYENGRVKFSELAPLSRLGGFAYAALGDTFELKVPAAG